MKRIIILCSILFALVIKMHGQAGPLSITDMNHVYVQNFNTLTAASNWTDNTTLTGWYAKGGAGVPAGYGLNNGSTTTVSSNFLFSFGAGAGADRALGFVPSGANNSLQYLGWRLKNNTGSTITNLSVNWDGEQWRKGSTTSQSVEFKYKISASAFTVIPTLGLSPVINSFTSTQNLASGESATAIDGNDVSNRATNSISIALSIPNGSEIMLVWIDKKDQYEHFFAIDNVSVTASTQTTQTITFPTIDDKTFGDAPFDLEAVSTSGLTVSYSSSNTNVATISGNEVTIRGPGIASITATQSGNPSYSAATPVVRTINVSPAKPVLNAPASITTSSFAASWTASNGLNDANISYYLEVDTDPAFGSPALYNPSSKSQSVTGLTSGRVYNYRVVSTYNDDLFSEYSESQSVSIGSITASTPGNWSEVIGNNTIAGKITINAPIVVDTDPDLDELIITNTGSLTVNVGQTLKINDKLIINSDADNNTGKIWNKGTVSIPNAAQIIVRKSFNTGKWYFCGFPFTIAAIYHDETTNPVSWGNGSTAGDIYVKRYNGDIRAANGITNTVWNYFSPNQLIGNKGYILWTHNNNAYDFVITAANKGAIFNATASYSTPIFNSAQDIHKSWNLVTNPFVSTFNLGHSSQGPYYVYNENSETYQVVMPGANFDLKPLTAFFLQATDATLNFETTGRKLVSGSVSSQHVDFDEVNLILSNAKYSDLTQIRLQEGASDSYVLGTDATKFVSMNSVVPQLYSQVKNTTFAVNTVAFDTKEVELYVKIGAVGDYSISLVDLEKIPNCSKVLLVDKVTGEEVDMLLNTVYNFSAPVAGTFNRFKVILSTENVNLSTDNNEIIDGIEILRRANQVAFNGLNSSAEVRIFDLTGKILNKYQGVNNNEYIDLPTVGVGLIQVVSLGKTFSVKAINL